MVVGVHWARVREVGVPPLPRLYQAVVYPVDLVHAPVSVLGPHLNMWGLLQGSDGVNITLGFDFDFSTIGSSRAMVFLTRPHCHPSIQVVINKILGQVHVVRGTQQDPDPVQEIIAGYLSCNLLLR